MQLRHRRPHKGPQRHLNPPYGAANRRHGGRLHVRAEGAETYPRHDRPKHRDSGGPIDPGINTANASQAIAERIAGDSGKAGQKRGGAVGKERKRGGRTAHRADGGSTDSQNNALNTQMQGAAQDPTKSSGYRQMQQALGASFPDKGDDVDKRKSGGKTDGHWMEKAFANSHGQFRAKAKKAGKSVAAEAAAVTKPGSHASTKTKRQANLAKLGAKYGGHHKD